MNVLIADDHELVRRGLKDLLRDEFDDLTIAEASGAAELSAKLDEGHWQLILLDISMPDFDVVETIREIRERDSHVPVLILTASTEREYAVQTLKAGASGYITKQEAPKQLIQAVRKVLAGDTYLTDSAVNVLADSLREQPTDTAHELLSKRELEIFVLIARGKAVKTIAHDLSISAKTVSTYIARIKEKTGLTKPADIARYAVQHGLLE